MRHDQRLVEGGEHLADGLIQPSVRRLVANRQRSVAGANFYLYPRAR